MNSPKSILITGGRVIDPANGFDAVADLLIVDGKIAAARPRRRRASPAANSPV